MKTRPALLLAILSVLLPNIVLLVEHIDTKTHIFGLITTYLIELDAFLLTLFPLYLRAMDEEAASKDRFFYPVQPLLIGVAQPFIIVMILLSMGCLRSPNGLQAIIVPLIVIGSILGIICGNTYKRNVRKKQTTETLS